LRRQVTGGGRWLRSTPPSLARWQRD